MSGPEGAASSSEANRLFSLPSVSLPKGGGAIRGIGEKFAANPVTGTGTMSVPLSVSPARSGFGPQLSLSYDSGSGNGPFGFGWTLSLPAISRKTDKGLPQYADAEESDVYVLSGAEDLVPVLEPDGTRFVDDTTFPGYVVHRYRPRIEGLFARIERFTSLATGEIHWRSITRDNVTTLYGKKNSCRIFHPADHSPAHPARIFAWLICASYDDKGNAIVYEYAAENDDNVKRDEANECNRVRTANRYLKRIKYGNREPNRAAATWEASDPSQLPKDTWMFEVVFDYGEPHYQEIDFDPAKPEAEQHRSVLASDLPDLPLDGRGLGWSVRPDPFSSYRSGFEVRTYRRCHRVLMFHHIPDLPDGERGYDGLVRSTELDYADLSYENGVTVEDELSHQGSTRFASFIRAVTQSGYLRDDTHAGVEQNGVAYPTYLKKSMPPLEFEYSKATIRDEILELDAESRENLPIGLDGAVYQWIDLHGEGIPGALTEQGRAWFYKRNLTPLPVRDEPEPSKARLAPLEVVAAKPNLEVSGAQAQFMDLAGDGQPDLVVMNGPVPGLYEHDSEEGWEPFRPFSSHLTRETGDPNLRFLDLDGDGHADALITEDDAFVWHPSLAEEGFAPGIKLTHAWNEEKGPRLVFADGAQSIYVADMSGDGLTDLVRIRNGEVCYWPNVGYGRFGAKVTMDNAPWFDQPDQFDQRRVRLADIDGSGTNDVIYLGQDGAQLYFNESGNRLSDPRRLVRFPQIDNVSSVMTADLLGNGTACLVWSSPLPADAHRPMRYIDLMGGIKPHLLVRSVNNLGAETKIQYSPSTKFYLADKYDGRPWLTRLPFPVHVVERVITQDRISGNRFVTRYAYHHGYFDGIEREFRGFGMIEQWDTEEIGTVGPEVTGGEDTNWDTVSFVPPVLAKTWIHNGVFDEDGLISNRFEHEYYREGDPSLGEGELTEEQLQAMLLPDTVLPDGLSAEEAREACRSLKGAILRQEIYARDRRPDGSLSERSDRPYSVSERNYTIKRLQPLGDNKHAVFFTHARETVDFHYERKLYDITGEQRADPRVTHSVTLDVDDYGNVLKVVSIGYGRRFLDPDPVFTAQDRDKQRETLLTLTENRYTNPVLLDDAYRSPLPCESRTYELLNVRPDGALPQVTNLFRFDEIQAKAEAAGDGVHELAYEDVDHLGATEDHPYRRLIEQVCTRYRPDDLGVSQNDDPNVLLPIGQLEPLALPGESYKLALTPRLVQQIYVDNGKLAAGAVDDLLAEDGHYVHSEGDANWWIPTGRVFYSSNRDDGAAQELTFGRDHFFLPHRFRDPFAQTTCIRYDVYDLLPVESEDPLHNRITVGERNVQDRITSNGNDYRALQAALITDANRNRSAAAFDALALVVATAVMGKKPEPAGRPEGDWLDDFTQEDANPTLDGLQDFVADPQGQAHGLLKSATTRIVYELDRYMRCGQPPFASVLARETHVSGLPANEQSRIRVSFVYSDGFGREVQTKIQAEPGDAPWREPALRSVETGDAAPGPLVYENGELQTRPTDHRWVGTGRTVYNNKGKPIKKYEPFFSSSHLYEPEPEMTDTGLTPVLFYDPVERVIATLHPNNTYDKVVFDPWRQATYDVNDTVTSDPRSDEDLRGYTDKHFAAQPGDWQTWHARRIEDQASAAEQDAAAKAAVHADTPTVAFFDALGRPFLTVAHNKYQRGDETIEEKYDTRVELDVEGNQRAVIDARGLVVMRYDYDMLGARVHQDSMDAGQRWMLNNVAGQPIRAWDKREHTFRTTYDELERPTHLFVRRRDSVEVLVERTVYGEVHLDAIPLNMRGKVYQHYDQAGVVTNMGRNPSTNQNEAYDFKGNLLSSSRRLAREYRSTRDWSSLSGLTNIEELEAAADPLLETETFTGSTTYDALNRPVRLTTPDNSSIRPAYNEANLLNTVDVNLRGEQENGQPEWVPCVTNINYNAKGQRTLIEYGNRASTAYEYEKETYRLMHLSTTRPPGLNGLASPLFVNPATVQDLGYTYDPVGNITNMTDSALAPVFHNNEQVEPVSDYTYDATYRLISAQGREHIAQATLNFTPSNGSYRDYPFAGLRAHPNDPEAVRNYTETYEYDEVGNILRMIHLASGGDWTRHYAYADDSNRVLATSLPDDHPLGPYTAQYQYDEHGNMIRMSHLPLMQWDYRDQLQAASQQLVNNGGTPEMTYYVYDAAGQRVRKVTEGYGAPGQIPARKEERIYLGGFEVYRKYNGDGSSVTLERETLHIMDDKQRIALVETRTQGDDGSPAELIRYQFGNHLGSTALELDESGEIISYEEYHAYGSTSYQAVRSGVEVSQKRYRYTGKERDEESGLYYHGARYYAPWLGRWTSCDPAGMVDGPNLYSYVRNTPVTFVDSTGTQVDPDEDSPEEDPDSGDDMYTDPALVIAYEFDRGRTSAALGTILANYLVHDIPPRPHDLSVVGSSASAGLMMGRAQARAQFESRSRTSAGPQPVPTSTNGANPPRPGLGANLRPATPTPADGPPRRALPEEPPPRPVPQNPRPGPAPAAAAPPEPPEAAPSPAGGLSQLQRRPGYSSPGEGYTLAEGALRRRVASMGGNRRIAGTFSGAEIELREGVRLRTYRRNVPGGAHAETPGPRARTGGLHQRLQGLIRAGRITPAQVRAFFIEYCPCSACTAILIRHYPDAPIYYVRPYINPITGAGSRNRARLGQQVSEALQRSRSRNE